MKTFKSFLTESLSPEQFPLAMRTPEVAKRLPKVLAAMNDALAQGAIPNPRFNDLKSGVNYTIELALHKPEWLLDAVFRNENRGTFTLWNVESSTPYSNQLVGKLKALKAAKPKSDADKTFLSWAIPATGELVPLGAAMEALKGMVVKRMPKSAEEKDAVKKSYGVKMASIDSGRVVAATLVNLTNQLKGDYAKAVADYLIQRAEEFAGLSPDEQSKKREWVRDVGQIGDAWQRADLYDRRKNGVKLVDGYRKVCTAAADESADAMQVSFVQKNTEKLVAILHAKGINLASDPQILHANAGRGVFEGEIRITFVDGSRFNVRNKIVLKRNNYGTMFTQYPTTFHDVVLPDGSKMGMPSEERMNEVFAKG